MRWHRLKLTIDGPCTGARIWRLLWEASVAGEPRDNGNAIFIESDGRGGATLYFPPSAQLLATAVGARRCSKPDPVQLSVLAGPQSSWSVHFGTGAAARPPAYRSANTRSA